MDGYCVTYNSYLKKYLSFDYGSGISVCTDLEKQDWTPVYKVPGDYWGCKYYNNMATTVTNLDKMNLFSSGESLYLYSYFIAQNKPIASLCKIDFSKSQKPTTVPQTLYVPSICQLFMSYASADPAPICPVEPSFESFDPIESRHARRVHCTHPETSYTGKWSNDYYDLYREHTIKTTETAKNTVEFSFRGSDIYWRAVKGPDCGLADVYIDGVFQKTVDCYCQIKTANQIAFVKQGLNPKENHTIKVVVRGEKDEYSTGANIRHLLFEYSAESYRASDCFSSIQGKNNWYYQENMGNGYKNLNWGHDIRIAPDYQMWMGSNCENDFSQRNHIEFFSVKVTSGDLARKWVAPHAGTVRVEGIVGVGNDNAENNVFGGATNLIGRSVTESVNLNDKEIWSSGDIKPTEKKSHDLTLDIKKGDVIFFIAHGNCDTNVAEVFWDPVVTYVNDTGEVK